MAQLTEVALADAQRYELACCHIFDGLGLSPELRRQHTFESIDGMLTGYEELTKGGKYINGGSCNIPGPRPYCKPAHCCNMHDLISTLLYSTNACSMQLQELVQHLSHAHLAMRVCRYPAMLPESAFQQFAC
jgi:hypothetical protein